MSLEKLAHQCLDDLDNVRGPEYSSVRTSIMIRAMKEAHRILSELQKPHPDPEKVEAFNQFWKLYNKRIARHKAYALFMKLKQEDIDQILKTVELFVKINADINFRPHPTTYLSQRRWEDELVPRKEMTRPKFAKDNNWTW